MIISFLTQLELWSSSLRDLHLWYVSVKHLSPCHFIPCPFHSLQITAVKRHHKKYYYNGKFNREARLKNFINSTVMPSCKI